MAQTLTIIGNYISPYVRKVLVCLELKGIPYRIDPIAPFVGNEDFSRLSPLRRIPVLIEGDLVLNDSTVICEYLQDRFSTPSLYPADPVERAKARWLEEYADTRMGDVFIWRLFNQRVIRPFVWGEATDDAVVEKTLAEDVPAVLDYLESQAPADGFFFGALSIADVAVAVFFRNAGWARFKIDAARWPRIAGLVDRTLRSDGFQAVRPFEDASMKTPPTEQRAALLALGAPLTKESYGTSTPRRGVMSV